MLFDRRGNQCNVSFFPVESFIDSSMEKSEQECRRKSLGLGLLKVLPRQAGAAAAPPGHWPGGAAQGSSSPQPPHGHSRRDGTQGSASLETARP